MTQFSALQTSRSVRTRRLAAAEENLEVARAARLAQIFKEICDGIISYKGESRPGWGVGAEPLRYWSDVVSHGGCSVHVVGMGAMRLSANLGSCQLSHAHLPDPQPLFL